MPVSLSTSHDVNMHTLIKVTLFCCEERSGCHSTCNSYSQLSVNSYRVSELLPPPPGTGTALNKDHMSSHQEVAQPKLNPVLKTYTCNN